MLAKINFNTVQFALISKEQFSLINKIGIKSYSISTPIGIRPVFRKKKKRKKKSPIFAHCSGVQKYSVGTSLILDTY